jgi:hypothetical protein
MQIDLSRTEGRLGLLGLGVFGVAHVLVPRLLLRIAQSAYGLALDVELSPRENAPRRVRWVGYLSLLLMAAGWRALEQVGEDPIELSVGGRSETASREHPAESHSH